MAGRKTLRIYEEVVTQTAERGVFSPHGQHVIVSPFLMFAAHAFLHPIKYPQANAFWKSHESTTPTCYRIENI